jgi:hypothetical protein
MAICSNKLILAFESITLYVIDRIGPYYIRFTESSSHKRSHYMLSLSWLSRAPGADRNIFQVDRIICDQLPHSSKLFYHRYYMYSLPQQRSWIVLHFPRPIWHPAILFLRASFLTLVLARRLYRATLVESDTVNIYCLHDLSDPPYLSCTARFIPTLTSLAQNPLSALDISPLTIGQTALGFQSSSVNGRVTQNLIYSG